MKALLGMYYYMRVREKCKHWIKIPKIGLVSRGESEYSIIIAGPGLPSPVPDSELTSTKRFTNLNIGL